MFFAGQFKALASDYQYKVLDPKYNPSAEELADGKVHTVEELTPIKSKKGFDFGTFFAILAMIAFPMFIISLAVKTFKEVTEDVPGRKQQEEQILGNIKIEGAKNNSQTEEVQRKSSENTPRTITSASENSSKPRVRSAKMSPQTTQMLKYRSGVSGYSTAPITKKILCC